MTDIEQLKAEVEEVRDYLKQTLDMLARAAQLGRETTAAMAAIEVKMTALEIAHDAEV